MVIQVFISSGLDYCNSLFTSLSITSVNCLQVVQNAAAKLVAKSMKWYFKILVITFRALHGEAPAYIKELLLPYSTSRTLRSTN